MDQVLELTKVDGGSNMQNVYKININNMELVDPACISASGDREML